MNYQARDIMYVNPPAIVFKKRPMLDDIATIVCEEFDVSFRDLYGAARIRRLAFPRKAFWQLGREFTPASLPMLGKYLGFRHHTTVMSGLRSFSRDYNRHAWFRENFDRAYQRVRML